MNDKKETSIINLDKSNSVFYIKNGFPAMRLVCNDEEKEFPRVFFHRNFPFDMPWKYISVLDDDQKEIGIISDVEIFEEETKNIIKTELSKKYYEPKIKSIISLKERYGFSYWKVITSDDREVSFTMQDTFRHIIRAGADKLIMLDVDGNRFVIDNVSDIDTKSYRKIELYL